MQNTRLNNLVDATAGQLGRWLLNPWRRLSLLVISLLFGFFLGGAISLSAGQRGVSDILAAGIILLFTEIVDRIYYSRNRQGREGTLISPLGMRGRSPRQGLTLWLEALNALKIGLTYSLFLEAFKLGS